MSISILEFYKRPYLLVLLAFRQIFLPKVFETLTIWNGKSSLQIITKLFILIHIFELILYILITLIYYKIVFLNIKVKSSNSFVSLWHWRHVFVFLFSSKISLLHSPFERNGQPKSEERNYNNRFWCRMGTEQNYKRFDVTDIIITSSHC